MKSSRPRARAEVLRHIVEVLDRRRTLFLVVPGGRDSPVTSVVESKRAIEPSATEASSLPPPPATSSVTGPSSGSGRGLPGGESGGEARRVHTSRPQLRRWKRDAERRFFASGTRRSFRRSVKGGVLEGPGGIYFVTLEPLAAQRSRRGRRKYTVQRAWPDGSTADVGRFERWTSARSAHAFARKLATGSPTSGGAAVRL